ncbi:hypothetical protein V2I80_07345 [Pseudomonas viridiflava]|uniref:hypothetical protein n=1 Tax=Pseudomonas viridiflava TaxID=33069 RepID=UPI002EB206CE|nr:hypothetical protein [Pseudomonas viridiflava]MEE3971780.1 hypothetical protein [Pseudomonas viridiflava]MEE4016630.1 hypothetical protein [Pseudomonas viridiflava]MEE4045254.1 hypothetical protein [Pseudomonas viridiflava]MEE4081986.1 hypothetical protein [Pseudomonas viridiflava]
MANTEGVNRLIAETKRTRGTPGYSAALEALGEAGGAAAVKFLIETLDSYSNFEDSSYPAAVKALGRACRS